MDLSKLPKLSNTPAPPPPDPVVAPAPQPVVIVAANPAMVIGDIWISLIVGILLIGMGVHFAEYAACRLTGREYHTGVTWREGPNAGSEVAYWDLDGHEALTNAATLFLGLVFVVDAAVMTLCTALKGPAAQAAIAPALLLTISATLFNLYVSILLFSDNIVPTISGLAVAVGGYIAFSQGRQWLVAGHLASARPTA